MTASPMNKLDDMARILRAIQHGDRGFEVIHLSKAEGTIVVRSIKTDLMYRIDVEPILGTA